MTTFRTLATTASLALVFTATLAGCSSNDSGSGSGTTAASSASSVDQAKAAVTLAEEHVPGSVAFELDSTRNGWEVEVVLAGQATEVQVNQEGTSVTGTRDDGRVDTDDSFRISRAEVEMNDAIATAAAAEGVSGRLTSVELDRFRVRTLVWAVEFQDGSTEIDVSIDAATGSVVDVDRD